MRKFTAKIKTIKEITKDAMYIAPWFLSREFIQYAGKRVSVKKSDVYKNSYIIIADDHSLAIPACWLSEIHEEIDWENVAQDTLIRDKDTGELLHFAEYIKYGNGNQIWAYRNGRSSKTYISKYIVRNPELIE